MSLWSRQQEFTKYLVEGFPEFELEGLSLKGACAITGNASVENQVKAQTLGPKDHGSDGVLQWRLARLDGPHGLRSWAKARGLPWNTLRTQAAFTLWELKFGEKPGDSRYRKLEKELREGIRSIETLTANFCVVYERPNMRVAHLDLRIRHAKSVFLLLGKEKAISAPTSSSAAAAGGAIITGTVLASANNADGGSLTISSSLLLFGFILAVVLWQMRKLPSEETSEDAFIEIPFDFDLTPNFDSDFESRPIELVASPTAAFEAAEKRCAELEEQLMEAKKLRDEEKAKLQAHVEELQRKIGKFNPNWKVNSNVDSTVKEKSDGNAA